VPAGAGLGRRRAVPSFRRHSFSACRPPRPRRVRRLRVPSSTSAGFAFAHRSLDSALSTSHFNPLHVESTFGVSWFADSLQPAELLASLGGPDQAIYSAQPTEAFTSELSAESVALLAVGYFYGGIWAPPPTGLSPVGTAASFAAQAIGIWKHFLISMGGSIPDHDSIPLANLPSAELDIAGSGPHQMRDRSRPA